MQLQILLTFEGVGKNNKIGCVVLVNMRFLLNVPLVLKHDSNLFPSYYGG